MRNSSKWPAALTVAAAAGLVAVGVPAGAADRSAAAPANSFRQTTLIASKASFGPKLVDKNLTNAWGLAAGPGEPIWVSGSGSGLASAYSGGVKGSPVALDLTVRVPGGHPTGQVCNPSRTAFRVGGPGGMPATFIVDTDAGSKAGSPGEIAAWNGGSSFLVEDSANGAAGGKTPPRAVFKGLALATTPKAGPELFAADVADARIDVFSRDFELKSTPGQFRDPRIPAGYTPFNIALLNGRLYVAYGKQNKSRTDVVEGAGLGFVDVYSVNGKLIRHLAGHGPLNAPWGLVIAPRGFGPFAGDLLVGNLGDGWINAFNLRTGRFAGPLKTPNGYPVAVSGLWGLEVGSSAFGGASSVVFSAGPAGYRDGLVGVLSPAPR